MKSGPASSGHRAFSFIVGVLLVSVMFVALDRTMDTVSAEPPFSADIMVSDIDENADQYYPDVVVASNGTIYVVWEDGRNDPTPGSPPYIVDIFIASSSNRGGRFSPNRQITNHSLSYMKTEPSIATSPDGTVFVTWWDNTGLYIQKSLDGMTFSDAVEVSTGVNGTFKVAPSICAPAAGKVHVAYSSPDGQEGRIFLATSDDGGDSFASVRVDDATGAFRTNPDLAVGVGGSIHVAWQDERNGDKDVYYSKSVDGGQTFSPNVRVNDDIGTANQDYPSLAVGASGTVYIVWRDWRHGNSDIFFSKSTDGGSTFGDGILNDNDVEVDDFPFAAMHDHPSVAVDGAEVIHVTWRDTRNGFSDQDVYFVSSEDGGSTFGDGLKNNNDIKVNDYLEDTVQEIPAMALTPDGSVCIVWYDNRNFASKRVDIYFSIFLGTAPDLEIAGGTLQDITFGPPSPQAEGTMVTITARFRNIGDDDALDVVVRFFDDSVDPQNQIGDDEIAPFVPAGGNASVSHDWVCQGIGVHTILVFLDPENEILEWKESNNLAGKTFEVLSATNPARPEDVNASLFGPDQTGVAITWALSTDDGGGRDTVERYDVYRGTDFVTEGVGYSLLGSVPKGTSTFVDPTGGVLDPNDYFYVVCAYNSSLGSSCSQSQGGKMNIPLTTGWNLRVFPLNLWISDLETIYRTIDFDVVRTYASDSSSWVSYHTAKGYGSRIVVDPTRAFWIQALDVGHFTIAGQVPRLVELELRRGWNLVALPYYASEVHLSDVLFAYPLGKFETFEPASPPYYLREVGYFESLEHKSAYWVQALEDVTMTIDN